MAEPTARLIQRALEQERLAVRERIWNVITKQVPAPQHLTDPIGLTWLQLIRLLDEEGVVTQGRPAPASEPGEGTP